jgi:Mrp family chromosome partitioning ATPase
MASELNINSRVDLFEAKQELEKARVQEGLAKLNQKKVLQERLENYSLSEIEGRKGLTNAKRLVGVLERDADLVRKAVPFINGALSTICPLCPGGIYLMGAASGTGKSTTTAAIAHALFAQGLKTFIVSNEETEAKILARIACMELDIDFNLYVQDKLPASYRKQVAHKILDIEPYVTVMDDPIASTTLEKIESILKEVNDSGKYSCVIVDFLQRINKSIVVPSIERTDALYRFKDIATDYAQHAKVPVVVMTQLIPLSSDETERNFESRIKWAKGWIEAAAAAIEIIKIKGIPVSTFYVAKGRFSKAEVSVSCKYENGRFTYVSKSELQDIKDQSQLDAINDLTSRTDKNDEDA